MALPAPIMNQIRSCAKNRFRHCSSRGVIVDLFGRFLAGLITNDLIALMPALRRLRLDQVEAHEVAVNVQSSVRIGAPVSIDDLGQCRCGDIIDIASYKEGVA